MARNPVMFVVEVGSVLVTAARESPTRASSPGSIAAWLWFTVLFANFAEAIAEGRGKAQADELRRTRAETIAHRRRPDGSLEDVPSSQLRVGDEVVVSAGEVIPADGEVIEGIASVDESAITGESAPVIRESGGDRSAVTGGTRVLSDQIVVRVTAQPGESFLDRMIALVEGAERQKTPNEIALNILLAGLTIVFLLAVVTLQPFAVYSGAEQEVIVLVALLVCLIPTTIGGLLSAIGIAGMDRLVRRNVLALCGPGGRGGGRLLDAPARQDRHDHARQPPGGRVPAAPGRRRARARRRRPALEPRRRDAGGTLDRRPREGALRPARARSSTRARSFPSRAETRMSGVDLDGRSIRKGAADAIRRWIEARGGSTPARARRRSSSGSRASGGTPLVVASDATALGVDPPQGRRQGGDARALRRSCGRWASAR